MTRQTEREVMAVMLTANAEAAAGVLRQASGSSDGSVVAAIAATRSLSVIVDDTMKALVVQARAEGHTWAEIGETLRVTRQAAFQRFGAAVIGEQDGNGRALEGAAERAVALVHDLLAGRWEVVEKDFTPKMQDILPRELLESTRTRVVEHWGVLVDTGPATVTVHDDLTVVDMSLVFERQAASCKAVFTSDGQVAGMLWTPRAGAESG